jgi:hypothetical protein
MTRRELGNLPRGAWGFGNRAEDFRRVQAEVNRGGALEVHSRIW